MKKSGGEETVDVSDASSEPNSLKSKRTPSGDEKSVRRDSPESPCYSTTGQMGGASWRSETSTFREMMRKRKAKYRTRLWRALAVAGGAATCDKRGYKTGPYLSI